MALRALLTQFKARALEQQLALARDDTAWARAELAKEHEASASARAELSARLTRAETALELVTQERQSAAAQLAHVERALADAQARHTDVAERLAALQTSSAADAQAARLELDTLRRSVALSDALLCTTSVPGSPCSVATLGAAAWYDLGLLAKQHVRRDALVPWLVAIRGVPALQASLAPHLAALRTQWYTYPDAFVRGAARVAPADALDIARTYDPTTAPHDVHDAADVARVVAHASPWTASFALALLHCTLRMAPTHEQVALADALVPSLLPAPAAARGAPFEQLTRLGMPPAFPTELAHAALRRWMRGNEAAAHALARLAQHTQGLACDGVDAAIAAAPAAATATSGSSCTGMGSAGSPSAPCSIRAGATTTSAATSRASAPASSRPPPR